MQREPPIMTKTRLGIVVGLLAVLVGIPSAHASSVPATHVQSGTYAVLDLRDSWTPKLGRYDLTGVTMGWLGVSIVRITSASYTPYLAPSLLRVSPATYCPVSQCGKAPALALDEPGESGHTRLRAGRYLVVVFGTAGSAGVLHLDGVPGRLSRFQASPHGADLHTYFGKGPEDHQNVLNAGERVPNQPAKHYLSGFAALATLTGPGTAEMLSCTSNDVPTPAVLAPYNCGVGLGLSFVETFGYPIETGADTRVTGYYAAGLVNPGGFTGTADQSYHAVSSSALSHLVILDWAIPLPF